jgi:hypothetical protein
MEQAEVDRIEEENLRLRTAAEQALLFLEEVAGRQPYGDRFEVEALITSISKALERPKD